MTFVGTNSSGFVGKQVVVRLPHYLVQDYLLAHVCIDEPVNDVVLTGFFSQTNSGVFNKISQKETVSLSKEQWCQIIIQQ